MTVAMMTASSIVPTCIEIAAEITSITTMSARFTVRISFIVAFGLMNLW